jgi:hypothetical protein
MLEVQNQQIKEEEECPCCGDLLLDTLQNRTVSGSFCAPKQVAIVTNATPKSVEFRTAFHQIEDSNSVKFV